MKVAALRNTDPWFARMHRAIEGGQLNATVLKDVPVENVVVVEDVDVNYDGPETGHRPWLRIAGLLSQVRPAVQLPYGVEELTFESRPGTQMDYRYDFTDEEIAALVLNKGLHRAGFAVPNEVTNIEWELPGRVDLLLVSPEGVDDPPLVFVEIHEQNSGQLTTENSGYELVEYFPDRMPETDAPTVEEQAAVLTRDDQIKDLFAHESLDDLVVEEDQGRKRPGVTRINETPEPTTFDELVAQANERREQVRQLTAAELRELDPERADAIYADRMAALVAEAMDEQGLEHSDDQVSPEDVDVELPDSEEDEEAAKRRAKARAMLEDEVDELDEDDQLGRRKTDLSFD